MGRDVFHLFLDEAFMISLGVLFIKIKRAFLRINGQEFAEFEYQVKAKFGDYRIRVIFEKQSSIKLVESSSSSLPQEQSPDPRQRRQAGG